MIIVLRLVKRLSIKIRSRCNDTHHFTLYDPLGCLRIFYLLTDCYFIPFGYQFIEITLHGMIWDAAHRRPFFLAAVLSGQRDLQFP